MWKNKKVKFAQTLFESEFESVFLLNGAGTVHQKTSFQANTGGMMAYNNPEQITSEATASSGDI